MKEREFDQAFRQAAVDMFHTELQNAERSADGIEVIENTFPGLAFQVWASHVERMTLAVVPVIDHIPSDLLRRYHTMMKRYLDVIEEAAVMAESAGVN
ncbi:hypothetical protein DESC_810090 [Desulfosarcina cetonica]|uniref:hypothetical protein n=1 Tax=Desulfosarcina cetonica TaxID=90730 RepID=UPI0006D0E4B9|nr:hypothetical protein [Desulfosarcina cetonica]VTR70519.1 hypothetical protein DESC_810090 [Desulfosarcina cetonica]